MGNEEFQELFEVAQKGDREALEKVAKMFKPLLLKHSIINGEMNEDCFQELNIELINCLKKLKIKDIDT